VGGPPDAKTALDHGLVDVAWSAPPLSTKLTESGDYRVIVRASQLKPVWTDNVLVTTQPFIDSNEEVLRNWLAALGQAMDLIHNDADRAAAAWSKGVDLEPSVLKTTLTQYRDAYTLEIARKGIQANVVAAQSLGQLKSPPPLDEMISADLLPRS
jgi:NitT/TauT family transport system substrate-binding protein